LLFVKAPHNRPNAERRTPNAERRTPNAERRTPNAERRTPNAERRTPNAERRTPAPMHAKSPAYLTLANSLQAQIEANVFRTGDRLPSVRDLCKDHRLSVETVLHTLRVLEDRALIEARPRSGFYVRQRHQFLEPRIKAMRLQVASVTIGRLRYESFHLGNSPDVIPLGVAVPSSDILPTAKLGRIISSLTRSARSEIVSYTDPAGHPKLRKQLARRSSDSGSFLTADDFIITNGTAEALALCLRAVCPPKAAVLVESPSYYGILEIIEHLGYRVIELPTDSKSGVSPEDIGRAIRSIPKIGACLLVTNYSNPLGCTLSDEKKQQIVELLGKNQIPLIEDDIYGDLCRPGEKRPTSAKSYDERGLVLLCGSISKTLAPGLRVGWVAPGRYREKILQLKTNQTLTSPTVTQMAVGEFLEHGAYDAHLRKIRACLADQLQKCSRAVADYFPSGIRVSRPQGSFVLWIELPSSVDTTELARRAMNVHRISIAPGCIFSANGKQYRNCLRLSCGHPWTDRFEEAIKTLGKLVCG
jgi:DNA-binding transcriptional MocR family regulator